MGYMHVNNLYKDQRVLMFREVYALEKIHGTSAHVSWDVSDDLRFHSGGEKNERFVALFSRDELRAGFAAVGHPRITVYGEAYGGKQQGQSWRYGKELKFVAFDVRIGDSWLAVPRAEEVCKKLGIEFVHYVQTEATAEQLNYWRDAPSEQARRNGVGDHPREGIVIRPLVELTTNNGERVMAKHKRDDERETRRAREVADPKKLEVLEKADAIAEEWVTPTRLEHVIDKLLAGAPDTLWNGKSSISEASDTPLVIAAMTEDVFREAGEEIVDSREARKAIGSATARLFKTWLNSRIGS